MCDINNIWFFEYKTVTTYVGHLIWIFLVGCMCVGFMSEHESAILFCDLPSWEEYYIHQIHKNGGCAEEVWGELSATWSQGILGY